MEPNGSTEPAGKRPRLAGGYNDVVPVSAPGIAGAASQAPAVSYAMGVPNVSSAVSMPNVSYAPASSASAMDFNLHTPSSNVAVNGHMGSIGGAAAAMQAPSMGGPGAAQRPGRPEASAEQRRYAIQQQLMLLIHAYKCQLPSTADAHAGAQACHVRFCSVMKKVLEHMSKCQLGRKCTEPHCGSSRQIIAHYSSCKNATCPICAPLRKGGKAAALAGSPGSGTFGGGGGGAVPVMGGGGAAMLTPTIKQEQPGGMVAPMGVAYGAPAASVDWRSKVQPTQRQKLTSKVIEQLTACVSPADQKEKAEQIRSLGRKIEENVWNTARQQDEYYHLLAEKIYKLKKAHESRRSGAPRTVAPVKVREEPKPWNKEEVLHHFLPLHNEIVDLPEAEAFRHPVDVERLGLQDYHDIIKRPMDLQTIGQKLHHGMYTDPWDYCDDMRLMVDNAHLYNRKNSPVYKNASKILSTWEEKVELIMKRMGFCCGQRRAFHPKVLYCYTKMTHHIPVDTRYMLRPNKENPSEPGITFCTKCFKEQKKGNEIFVDDVGNGESATFFVKEFTECTNNHVEYETFTRCEVCKRKFHEICVTWHKLLGIPFVCDPCQSRYHYTNLPKNKFTSEALQPTSLGKYLEDKLNTFLLTKSQDKHVGRVVVRVVNIRNKSFNVNKETLEYYQEKGEPFPSELCYRSKALFVFQKQKGYDVCFFGMHVQEYGEDAVESNRRRVYISYLDSVHYFDPSHLRTEVYHMLLISYLEYVRELGFFYAHIWACPPSPGDDYIFHCHPEQQRTLNTKRLQTWYRKMLEKAKSQGVIEDYVNLDTYIFSQGLIKANEIPYFEGDFWPNRLEGTIQDIKNGTGEADGEADGKGDGKGDKKGKKGKKGKSKGGNKRGKANAKKGGKRRPTTSAEMDFEDEALNRLMEEVKKHRDAFFVVQLPRTLDSLIPMRQDPDKDITCELMDGRDQFLTLCRDNNYEFSSDRRARFSSMMMLYHLHNAESSDVTYSCNRCATSLSAMDFRYHCVGGCEDFDLCKDCKAIGHEHELQQQGLGLSSGGVSGSSTDAQRRETLGRALIALDHAVQCTQDQCRESGCEQIKRMLHHVRTCTRKQETGRNCSECKPLLVVIFNHARTCKKRPCPIPYCNQYRHSRSQSKAQKMQMRRIQNMQHGAGQAPTQPHQQAPTAAAAATSIATGAMAAAPNSHTAPSLSVVQAAAAHRAGPMSADAARVAKALRALTPQELEKYRGADAHLSKTRKAMQVLQQKMQSGETSSEDQSKLETLHKVEKRLFEIEQQLLRAGLARAREQSKRADEGLKQVLMALLRARTEEERQQLLSQQQPEDQRRLRDALVRRQRLFEEKQRLQLAQRQQLGIAPGMDGQQGGMPGGVQGITLPGNHGQDSSTSNAARLAEISDTL